MDVNDGDEEGPATPSSDRERMRGIAAKMSATFETGKWSVEDQITLHEIRVGLGNAGENDIFLAGIDQILLQGAILITRKHIEHGKLQSAQLQIRNLELRANPLFSSVLLNLRQESMGLIFWGTPKHYKDLQHLKELTAVLRDLHLAVRAAERNPNTNEFVYPILFRTRPAELVTQKKNPTSAPDMTEPISATELRAVLLTTAMLDAWLGLHHGLIREDLIVDLFTDVEKHGTAVEKEYATNVRDMYKQSKARDANIDERLRVIRQSYGEEAYDNDEEEGAYETYEDDDEYDET